MPIPADILEDPYEFQKLLGFTITEWTHDLCELHQPMHKGLGNRYGIPHGGIYASLLDTVMGYSGCFTGSKDNLKQAMTLSLNVSYLSRPKGKILIATGQRIGGGARTFFAEAKLCDETGEFIASASGTFRYRSN
ncbi:MAG: PaaI family thioesterase [Rhodobacterales bacterium]